MIINSSWNLFLLGRVSVNYCKNVGYDNALLIAIASVSKYKIMNPKNYCIKNSRLMVDEDTEFYY